jgi:hypothetical protein
MSGVNGRARLTRFAGKNSQADGRAELCEAAPARSAPPSALLDAASSTPLLDAASSCALLDAATPTMSPERATRSGKTPAAGAPREGRGKPGQARRTRGCNSKRRSHGPEAGRNGQGLASIEEKRAASDDASGTSAAVAAHSAAAGADRHACAEVAQAPPQGERTPRVSSEAVPERKNDAPLPSDGADFVDAVHARVDLIDVGKQLLQSGDEKIKQRAFERMLELRYGKGAPPVEEAQHIVIDLPRPVRD